MTRRLLFLLLLFPLATPAQAADRVALVIGNGNYISTTKLANPPNDAADTASALKGLGFDVIEGRDLERRAMEDKIKAFARNLSSAKIALFYYAGHALQVSGKNYLLPIDAKLERPGDLSFETIELGAVLAQMESGNSLSNVVILDACRNNPLAGSLANSYGPSRSAEVGRGLSMTLSRVGTMIVYSTQPDNIALDGAGRNSPFTTALLKHIRTPGTDISLLMRRVRVDVVAATDAKQVPWDHSSLMGEVILAPLSQEAQQVASVVPSPEAAPPVPTAVVSAQPVRQVRLRSTNEVCANSANAIGVNRYCASSMLPPQLGINYGVQNLFSPDPLTAWIEGVPGLGVGEWISVDFDKSRVVRSIALQNGYQKSSDIFNKNARVQRLKLVFSEGESLSIKLEDRMGWQKIELNRAIKADWVQFVIEDVYPGSRYTDTAISKLSIASDRAQ